MVHIVSFDPGKHLGAWREFIAASYRNPEYVLLSDAFRRWQFLDNPANDTGAHTLWLIVHNEDVVAQLGFAPFTGDGPDGEAFTGAYPINLIVRPDYRALGLGAILLSRLLKTYRFVVNPGSSEAGATLCAGLGMRDLGTLDRYIAIIDPNAALAFTADRRLPAGVSPVSRDADLAAEGIRPLRELPEGAPDRFAPPVAARHAKRDRTFFGWRYERHPGIDYEFLLDPSGRNVLVFHEELEAGSGAKLFRIVDLLTDDMAAPQLLAALIRQAIKRGVALADFYCSLDCYRPVLEQAGFFREQDHPGAQIAALFQPLDFRKMGIRVLVPDSDPGTPWYISKADSDQDRPNDAGLVERRAAALGAPVPN